MNYNGACPHCESSDYEVQGYDEICENDYFSQIWYCQCDNCKSRFTITRLYELKKVEVS